MLSCIRRFFGRDTKPDKPRHPPLPLAGVAEAWMLELESHYELGVFSCAQFVRWIGETVYGPSGYEWGMHRVKGDPRVPFTDPRAAHAILYVSDGVHCWWADVTPMRTRRKPEVYASLDEHGEPLSRLMTPTELAGGWLADYPENWRV